LGTLLTKLVNEINMDWDGHLPTYKVAIKYTSY